MFSRVAFQSCIVVLTLSQTAAVKSAPKNNDTPSTRRWKVEIQKNGKWVDSAVFDA
jgi:hypothetical protein